MVGRRDEPAELVFCVKQGVRPCLEQALHLPDSLLRHIARQCLFEA